MVKHKEINGVEKKHCGTCKSKKWKTLDEFGNDKSTRDKKKHNCKSCRNSWKKQCEFPECTTYAVHNYKCCKRHGGGKKCKLCDTSARNKSDYCVKHNPEKCIIDGCKNKQISDNNTCLLHTEKKHCKYNGCKKSKCHNMNGYCKNHGPKIYCKKDNCNKIQKQYGYCNEHYCGDDIEKCAKILLIRYKKQDKKKKKETTLTAQDIINKFKKNENCHWCKNKLKVQCGGKFYLEKITIDRIDNNNPHTNNNCVLSCLFCNFAKSACKEEIWEEVINILNGNVNEIDFTKYEMDMRICRRGANEAKKEIYKNKVDTLWIYNQLINNKWKCMLTGLPLYPSTEKYFPWDISTDRIDGSKRHIKDNCIITTFFINLGKNRIPNEEFKIWFKKRFPKCKINKVKYPKNFNKKFISSYNKYVNRINNKRNTSAPQ